MFPIKIDDLEIKVCPYYTEQGLCSIYERRPQCCRSYPGKGKKFPFADHVSHICDSDCPNCKTRCCTQITILKNVIQTPEEFILGLDHSCANCKKEFC